MDARIVAGALAAALAAGCGSGGITNGGSDGAARDGTEGGFDARASVDASPAPPTRLEAAAHWAPVFYHDSDSSDYDADYIMAVDFDGDWRGDNNWENLDRAGVDKRAVIYYSVIESGTHWFLLYADFHPRDWDETCQPIPWGPDRCHENDMEGAMVVVAKDGSRFGSFVLLVTEAHNNLNIFTNDPAISASSSPRLQTTLVTFEDGTHPELYVESQGHGVCALHYANSDYCKHPTSGDPPEFPGGDGLVFRVGDAGETPTSGNDRDVRYALRSLEDALWSRRGDICDSGCLYDKPMSYEGMRLGRAFDGDSHEDDSANPPWGWDDPEDGPVYTGDFFFRPAETLRTWLSMPRPPSTQYTFNPYLP